jgi:hypothetical protein
MNRSYKERIASNLLYYGLLLCSPAIGLILADIPSLRLFKLFNFIGVTWSIFGVMMLSYFVNTSEVFQLVVIRLSSLLFMWVLFMVPMGLCTGGIFGLVLHYPSAKIAATAGLYLLVPGALSAVMFSDIVRSPTFKFAKTPPQRIGAMGAYFIIVGLFSQWIGSLFELMDFNG